MRIRSTGASRHGGHKPIAAWFLSAGWRPDYCYEFRLDTLICNPGQEAEFYAGVDRLLTKGVTSVSFNGRGFDLSVLQTQAMSAGQFTLGGLSHHTYAHRYGPHHCDLADQFSGYGATRRVG